MSAVAAGGLAVLAFLGAWCGGYALGAVLAMRRRLDRVERLQEYQQRAIETTVQLVRAIDARAPSSGSGSRFKLVTGEGSTDGGGR